MAVEPVPADKIEQEAQLTQNKLTKDWACFVGYDGDTPVSISELFFTGKIVYLAWGYTAKEHRRKGHHRAHVFNRVESGCDLVFSVSDFNIPSSLSLQKTGFRLAYNYLMLELEADGGG